MRRRAGGRRGSLPLEKVSATSWPEIGLEVAELCGNGWEPLPFLEFIVKVHSRCNLACAYCYMYEMTDQSWRGQPMMMAEQVFDEVCRTIAGHVSRHQVPGVRLVFHGGEPLLVGDTALGWYARRAREVLEPVTEVRLGMQTNGVLLDEPILAVCDRWDIRVAVSVDGDRNGHDRHRTYRRGAGSYDHVVQGISLLSEPHFTHLFSGLLCTIDIANDPIATYEALIGFDPPAVDFLLPHGNWTTPPPCKGEHPAATPYADWLLPIFDRWYGAPTLQTRVRLFSDVMALSLGGDRSSEALGLAPVQLAVFETDGALEQVDELKSAFAGATRLRAVVGTANRLDAAMTDPAIVARQIGLAALSDSCLACPVHRVCGGGHYVHRYRDGSGFRNPSVYCADLLKLISHIQARIHPDITTALRPQPQESNSQNRKIGH
ncbi:MAG: FxsB family radical SAM/SPASM domain protein [Mycobacterium sp.]|nr:FxsB family radical SAM/SPASM domain protein [Mycobacterium sp.]